MQGLDIGTALDWRGRTVVDREGEKIGTLREIYLDEAERPAWGSVHTGLFGLRETLVPLGETQAQGDELRVPYDRDHVRDAPSIEPDVQLTADEEDLLYRHYGLATDATSETADTGEQTGAVADTSASESESQGTEDAMTRSEEEVRIGKRTKERGRVRLKKYVVTDYVQTEVPVKREEVRLEREPPDEGAARG